MFNEQKCCETKFDSEEGLGFRREMWNDYYLLSGRVVTFSPLRYICAPNAAADLSTAARLSLCVSVVRPSAAVIGSLVVVFEAPSMTAQTPSSVFAVTIAVADAPSFISSPIVSVDADATVVPATVLAPAAAASDSAASGSAFSLFTLLNFGLVTDRRF